MFHRLYLDLILGLKSDNAFYLLFWMMGFVATVILLLFFLEVSLFIIKKLKLKLKLKLNENISNKNSKAVKIDRRDFFKIAAVGTAATTISILGANETKHLHLNRVSIHHPNLPLELNGLKIGLMSDLHVGPLIKKERARRACDLLLSVTPDLIALTGDLADGHVDTLKDELLPLLDLQAPLGVFMVTGNHEYYWGADEWCDFYASSGITVLRNENQIVDVRGKKLMVAGVNDYHAPRFHHKDISDPSVAIKSNISADFKILLAHQPKSCEVAANSGFDLQLSGHTHGGQSLPFSIIVGFSQQYLSGLYKHKEMPLFVTNGAGYWGPPVRLGVPSEVVLLTLLKV